MSVSYPAYQKSGRVKEAEEKLASAENAAPGETVRAARRALESLSAPAAYRDVSAAERSSLLKRLKEQKPFSYDPEADELYRQYRDSYLQAGRRAMADTAATSAALTGGYGSSYAATAGAQAYGDRLSQLSEALPKLADLAYDRYRGDAEDLRSLYRLYADAEDQAYGRWRDGVSDYQNTRDYLADRYTDERDADEKRRRDARDYAAGRLDAERKWDGGRYDADLQRVLDLYKLALQEAQQAEKQREFNVRYGG